MSEYITKKEALELLGRTSPYLQKAVADGKITTIAYPTDGRKKLFLASDVYKLKADMCSAKVQQESGRKQCKELECERNIDDPVFQLDLSVKCLKLDLLDAVQPYGILASELCLYDEEVLAIAKLSENEQKEAFIELIHSIISTHRKPQ